MFKFFKKELTCSVCKGRLNKLREIAGFQYYKCQSCGLLQVSPQVIDEIDGGRSLVTYSGEYWSMELSAARARSWSSSLARVAEAIRYTQIEIHRFIDIGSGPGFLLDAIHAYLPSRSHHFYAYEAFPPPPEFRSTHANYKIGFVGEATEKFDAGVCIEVLEHLTPTMASSLAQQLARVSNIGATYLFNTGMPSFVEREDPNYLDPTVRGHIVSYSLEAVRLIFEPHGFVVHPLKGKTWAFVVVYKPSSAIASVDDLVWKSLPANIALLSDEKMGAVLPILGLESARAYWR